MTEAQLLLFEECDLLDVGGPYEVLLTANRMTEAAGGAAPFSVRTVTADGQQVRAFGGLTFGPHEAARPGPGCSWSPAPSTSRPPWTTPR